MLPRLDRLTLHDAPRPPAPKPTESRLDDIKERMNQSKLPLARSNSPPAAASEPGPSSAGAPGPPRPAVKRMRSWRRCPDSECNSLVLEEDDGMIRCQRCGLTNPSQMPNENEGIWGSPEEMREKRDEQAREASALADVTHRQNFYIEMEDIYPQTDPELLKEANDRLEQTMGWLDKLSLKNEQAVRALGVELSSNEVNVGYNLVRWAATQWAINGGKPRQGKNENKGSPIFWAIVVAQELIARRKAAGFSVPFYANRTYSYTLDGLHAFLEQYDKEEFFAGGSCVAATKRGDSEVYSEALSRTLKDVKWRTLKWDGLGDEDRRKAKMKTLDTLLRESQMIDDGESGLREEVAERTGPTVEAEFVPERERQRRRRAAEAEARRREEEAALQAALDDEMGTSAEEALSGSESSEEDADDNADVSEEEEEDALGSESSEEDADDNDDVDMDEDEEEEEGECEYEREEC